MYNTYVPSKIQTNKLFLAKLNILARGKATILKPWLRPLNDSKLMNIHFDKLVAMRVSHWTCGGKPSFLP